MRRQLRLGPQGRALLDLRTFRAKVFSVSVVMMAFCMVALFGMIILLPIYMQQVLGMEPVEAGLLLLPGGLLMGLLAPPIGRAYDRIGARRLVIPGSVFLCAGLWAMAALGVASPVWAVLLSHVLLSIGLALLFTPLFTSAMGALPQELYSHGSAVLGTVQQVAGAAGIALFVSVMSLRIAAETAAGAREAVGHASRPMMQRPRPVRPDPASRAADRSRPPPCPPHAPARKAARSTGR
ncbi:MFS transporter [Mangrovicoccus ximenensis]|uniref:MFS transporter n=1 Tax=Mangrovicoccus ximenensis TaxID=1911570 RepID=UPI001EFF94F9|nr:MFS transporter [Mangrovicoccus ximenensis]